MRISDGVQTCALPISMAYLVAPAVGPFIYEAGVNPMITGGQRSMLEFYRNAVATGPAFLAKHGSINFTVGLAAMPSLHSASAYLFFLFAWKHGKVLVPLYSFILAYILIMAVASRSEEHTSELQSLMRISYADLCLKKKNK